MTKHKVILDECQCIADSLTSVYENVGIYKRPVQARLDTLHFTEDGYRWAEGQLGMVPVHRRVAVRFVKSIVKILVNESASALYFVICLIYIYIFVICLICCVTISIHISHIDVLFRMSFRLVCSEHDLVWHPIFPKVAAPPSFVDRKPLEFKLQPKHVLNIPSHMLSHV